MPNAIDAEKTIRVLRILRTSEYRIRESVWVDPPNVQYKRVWYSWEESTAGEDDYAWTEEYHRIGMPLRWVEPLLLRASDDGRSEGVVPANYWSTIVYVNSYTGRGGTQKTSPRFDERSWSHELVLARLTLTPTTVAIEMRRTVDFLQSRA
jgi:hypothetical protein